MQAIAFLLLLIGLFLCISVLIYTIFKDLALYWSEDKQKNHLTKEK